MAKLAALMMDVDGVLVTGRPADGLPWATGLRDDLGLDPGDLHRAFFAPSWDAIVTGRRPLRPALEAALASVAPHLPAGRLIDYWFRNDARLDTALLAALARLRAAGLPVHLATNQEHERARYLLEDLGLAAHVDGCHHSAAIGCAKPDPAFFRTVAGRVGLPPAALLLVDDSAGNVEAARGAGWQALHWTAGSDLQAAVAAGD